MTPEKKMINLFEEFRYRHDLFTVFADFLEMAALSISNSVDLYHFEKREKRYLEIIGRYDRKEIDMFPQLLGELTNALEVEPTDVLGNIYGQLELSNKWRGQFFTPMSVSQMMAELTLTGYEEKIKEQGYITVNEPACGGGVTIIALANALRKNGYNYQQCMRVVAQDIDIKSVHMCYLQLSLLGVDAVVMRGDTLAYKFDDDVWKTPAHILRWTTGGEKAEPKKEEAFEQLSLF